MSSLTPFSDRFPGDKDLLPGVWWHVSYSVAAHIIGSIECKFDDDRAEFTLGSIDHELAELEKMYPGEHIFILSWSKFVVPKNTKEKA